MANLHTGPTAPYANQMNDPVNIDAEHNRNEACETIFSIADQLHGGLGDEEEANHSKNGSQRTLMSSRIGRHLSGLQDSVYRHWTQDVPLAIFLFSQYQEEKRRISPFR